MELVNRYVHEIGRRLPKRMRADVEAELQSLIMDALEDRCGEVDISEEDQVAVLKEMGPPARVAARYAPEKSYLVGPRLFPTYLVVLGAIALALSIAHIVLAGLAIQAGSFYLIDLAELIAAWFAALMSGLGTVTLIFFVIERFVPEEKTLTKEDLWEPRDLPEIDDFGRIGITGLVVESVIIVLLMILLNFYPQYHVVTGLFNDPDPASQFIFFSFLTGAFFALYLPLLNIAWVLTFVKNMLLLRQGRWQQSTRAYVFALSLFDIFILARMLTGPKFIDPLAMDISALMDPLVWQQTLAPLLGGMVRMVLVVALVLTSLMAVKELLAIFGIHSFKISEWVERIEHSDSK